MNAKNLFLIIFFVYIAGFLAHAAILKKVVYGDGVYYFSWLRSVVIDRDIDFTNEYTYFGTSQPTTPSGLPGNKYTPGPAIIWLPVFMYIHSVFRGNGYELPYQIAVGISGVLMSIAGLVILFRTLVKFFDTHTSLLSIALLAFGTNIWFYGSLDTANSHPVSFFASSVLLALTLDNPPQPFVTGLAVAFGTLTRTQDAANGIVALARMKGTNILYFLAGSVAGFLPQIIAWQILYGTFLTSPYLSDTEGFTFTNPHIIDVLLGSASGWFFWTPVVLPGVLGLISLSKHGVTRLRLLLIPVLLQVYLISAWSTWWQGASFSARMLISSLPYIVFGFAQFLTMHKLTIVNRWYAVSIIALINAFAMVYFLLQV